MPTFTQFIGRLAAPCLLLISSLYVVLHVNQIAIAYQPLLVYLPYPILIITLGLSQQFNCLRLFLNSLLLLLVYIVIHLGLQAPLAELKPNFYYTNISLLLPLNIGLLALIPERGIRSPFSYGMLFIFLIEFFLLAVLPNNLWVYVSNDVDLMALNPFSHYVLSLAATAFFALSGFILLVLFIKRKDETEACLLICLVANYLMLALFYHPYISSLLVTCCGLCMIYSVFIGSHNMAFRDELSCLRNRRSFNDALRSLSKRYVIATIDIDHFKKFNDKYGHEVGDDVLKLVASHIDRVEGGGVAYRYGGEEFCVIFRGMNIAEAFPFLDQLRESIASYKMTIRNQRDRPSSKQEGARQRGSVAKEKTVSVSVSIGVAAYEGRSSSPEEVLKASDQALYKAKKQGRNCVIAV